MIDQLHEILWRVSLDPSVKPVRVDGKPCRQAFRYDNEWCVVAYRIPDYYDIARSRHCNVALGLNGRMTLQLSDRLEWRND